MFRIKRLRRIIELAQIRKVTYLFVSKYSTGFSVPITLILTQTLGDNWTNMLPNFKQNVVFHKARKLKLQNVT